MHDILPDDSSAWQAFEDVVRKAMASYGYSEIRTPIVESTDLFSRSIGEVTDIVEKEMYTFEDRNGDMLTLRPEGTASCVRAGIQHGIIHNSVRRLWYMGPMFRHERPQKGRYRQFHQLGVETFGIASPDIDAELIMMGRRLWQDLCLDEIHLELNTLGNAEARGNYRNVLIDYLQSNRDKLDEDSIKRIDKNPLRVLDSKNPEIKSVIDNAPDLHDYLDNESSDDFNQLKNYLDTAGIKYLVNPRLVRGLDYYCKTVFEWVTDKLGAQGTVCAGGRYDGLVEQLGGKASPAAGFALGIERLLALMTELNTKQNNDCLNVYIMSPGESGSSYGLQLAEKLRSLYPLIKVQTHCGGGSFKSQLKKADKSGAKYAFILGESEINNNKVTVKYLRDKKEQQTVTIDEIAGLIQI